MNKEIELSISKNYVCNWRLWEAIREILQNAQDSAKDGYALSVEYSDNTLTIHNEGPKSLDISSLVLGNSMKSEGSIGKYGEGYKLALVVLLRLGYNPIILSGDEKWAPYFEYSDTYKTEVLKISISQNEDSHEGISFIIGGISGSDLEMLKEYSLLLARELGVDTGRKIVSEYGEVLMDERYSGQFYVEGLYIQSDSNFTYGYSFNSDVVNLDRDRRAINYYDLLDLTTDTLTSQTDDFSIVETSIVKKQKDTSQLNNFYRTWNDEFTEGYAKHFLEKHDIDEDTFIGTQKEVLVSGAPKTFVTDEVQAALVNQGLGKKEAYNHIKELAKKKDDAQLAYTYYNDSTLKKFHDWLVLNCNKLSNKQINSYLDICKDMRPSCYGLIEEYIVESLFEKIKEKEPNFSRKINHEI